MKPTLLILALSLATTTSGVFAAPVAADSDNGSMTAPAQDALGAPAAETDIFGRPIVEVDAVRELYRDEPWVNPLPEFWALEHRPSKAAAD